MVKKSKKKKLRRFRYEEDYPQEYEWIRVNNDEILAHPRYVRNKATTLYRDRKPVNEWEALRLRFSRWADPDLNWRVYYCNRLKVLVYSIPYFPYTGMFRAGYAPAAWSKKKSGCVAGTEYWSNGAFIIKSYRYKHCQDIVLPYSDEVSDLLSTDVGEWETVDQLLMVDHPEVYDLAQVVQARTANRHMYVDARYMDAACHCLYNYTPWIHMMSEDPRDWYLTFRVRRSRKQPVLAAIAPVIVGPEGEDLVLKLSGRASCDSLESMLE